MAGGKSSTYATNFITWALTTSAVTRPTSWTIALYTDATGRSTAPTTEVSGGGYARQTATFNTSGANTNDIAFTATGAWASPANYYAILDQSGAIIYWCPLSTPRQPAVSGDKVDFAIGAITVVEQ